MKEFNEKALYNRAWEVARETWPVVLVCSLAIQLANHGLTRLVKGNPVLIVLTGLLVMLLLALPSLGLTRGVLEHCRGKRIGLGCMASMARFWRQVCVYELWLVLRMTAWALVGLIPMFAGASLVRSTGFGALGRMLVSGGELLMNVALTYACVNYSLSQCVLVDDPHVGGNNALKQGKKMIYGYRWYFVMLWLPVMVVLVIPRFVLKLASLMLPELLSGLLTGAVEVFLSVLSYCFIPVMYEELKRIGR